MYWNFALTFVNYRQVHAFSGLGGERAESMQTTGRTLEELVIKSQRAAHKAPMFPPGSKLRKDWRRVADRYRQLAKDARANDAEKSVH